MVRGQVMYVPKELVMELDELKFDFGLKKRSDCFKILAKSSRLGRELGRRLR